MKIEELTNNTNAARMAGEITNEQDVKNITIRPLITGVWEYAYGNGVGKYKEEYPLPQIGSKPHHSACDYRIETSGAIVIVEGKGPNESLDNPKHIAELKSYVKNLGGSMGIMCNGKEIAFYMADASNDMEETPFRTISFENPLSTDDKKFLDLMKAPGSNLEKFRLEYEKATTAAKQEAEVVAVANFLENRATKLSEAEEKEIVKLLEPGRTVVTPVALENKRTIIQAGIMRFQANQVQKYRKHAAEADAKYQNNLEMPENLVYGLTYGIVADMVADTPVKISDFASGELAKIHLNGQKSGQPILWVIGKIEDNSYHFKGIAFPKENGDQGELVPLSAPTDILAMRDRIREETEISLRGPRFKTKTEQQETDPSVAVSEVA